MHHHNHRRQLSQQLITQSKLLMSARLVQIENQILSRFEQCKDKQFVKRMFYRNMDQLVTLQQKISYLLIVLEEIDSQRLDKYMRSSLYDFYDFEPQTDTSMQMIEQDGIGITKTMKKTQYHNEVKNNATPFKHQTNDNTKQLLNHAKFKGNLLSTLTKTAQSKDSKHYCKIPIDNTQQTDEAIISSLQNSSNSHLYKDLINIHRQQKLETQLISTDTMIENQKILHQLRKLSMEKKLLKYQSQRTPSYHYSQQASSPLTYLESRTNQYPVQHNKSYYSDFQQQTDIQSTTKDYKTNNNDRNVNFKLSKNYQTTMPKYSSSSDIKSSKNNIKNSNSLNDLFSFRPNQNIKKQFKDHRDKENIRVELLGKDNNKRKSQLCDNNNRFLVQDYDEQSERNFEKGLDWRGYQNRSQGGLMSEQDSWLIERLNRKICQQDSLNSMLNNRRPFRMDSEKKLQEYESKLRRLQEERFVNEKQSQLRSNPFGQVSDRGLKQRLMGFKSWLKNQPPSSRVNQHNYNKQEGDQNDKMRLANFNTNQDLNKFGDYINNNDKDYICYSQSQLQSMAEFYQRQQKKRNNNERDRMFKKKPQLIITQTQQKKKRNNRSKTKSKSKSMGKDLMNRTKSKSKSKSSFKHLYSHSKSKSKSRQKITGPTLKSKNLIHKAYCSQSPGTKKLSNYLPKSSTKKSHSKQKHYESNKSCSYMNSNEDDKTVEKRANCRLLNRVRSALNMMEMPYSREKEDKQQLLNRYLLDDKRQQQVKQKILTNNSALNIKNTIHSAYETY